MRTIACILSAFAAFASIANAAEIRSHPPLRPFPQPSDRPLAQGPTWFVDPAGGSDENEGTKDKAWKTIAHGLRQISAGDTLCLRGGAYYEQVYCAVAGTADRPITIRSYPGELAIIDGAFREFAENPADAWEPVNDGAEGEFRSQRSYKNLRNTLGSFADSMIGLQVYHYPEDLRGERYVGPGIWYDAATGRIHARLARYHAEEVVRGRTEQTLKYFPSPLHHLQSYEGETDPRQLPLIIAPLHSVPLKIDGAKHVAFEDLVIRGGGYDAVDIRRSEKVTFDNVTIYAGTYGLRIRNTGPLTITNSAIRGSVPPWSTRGETSLREYPWVEGRKDLTRMSTHALLVPASGDEYSVDYFPYNHDWEVSYSEFTDAHDGVYLGDIVGLKFHHNYVNNMQDDGVYLSSFRKLYYPEFGPREIYQNVITGCLMAFAFGGDARLSSPVQVYRNILDGFWPIADHGGPPWEGMTWYHNTIFGSPRFVFRTTHPKDETLPWEIRNNIIQTGQPNPVVSSTPDKPHGNFAGDPGFEKQNSFQLMAGSSAIDSGVPIPSDWPDPLRSKDKAAPDAGALPYGAGPLKVGQFGRISF